MPNIKFPDGNSRFFDAGVNGFIIAESILLGNKKKFHFTYHEDVKDLIEKGKIKPN